MRYIWFIALFVICSPILATAQSVEELSDGYVKETEATYTPLDTMRTEPVKEQKLTFGLSGGTGVSYSSAYGASMSTFLAPHLSYRVSPKFSVNAGLRLQVNSLNNSFSYPTGEGNAVTFYRPATQTFLYTEGVYQVNKKLTLSGTVFAEINTFDIPGLKSSSYNLNTYGGILGMQYKVGKNSTISAEIQISRGASPQQGNPLFYPGRERHETLPIW
jgi:hypothetical protein